MQRTLAATALLLLVAVFAWRPITDTDFALHAAGGRWIAEHRAVPETDPFTYTVSGSPYLAYHWLFQLAAYALLEAGGGIALTLAQGLGVLATALCMLDVLRRRRSSALAGSLVGVAAILTIEYRFFFRPELVTYLLAAATLWVLDRARAGRAEWLWLLPVIQILWVNTHLFAVGWILMLAYLGEELLLRRGSLRRLAGWVVGAMLVTLLNPYYIEGVLYPVVLSTRMQADDVFAQSIIELASPLQVFLNGPASFANGPQLKAYGLLLVLGLVALPMLVRGKRFADAAIVIVFGGLSLSAVRNTALYALVALPALCTGLDDLGERLARRFRPAILRLASTSLFGIAIGFGLLTAARVVDGAYYREALRPERFRAGLCGECLAMASGDWVAASGLVGPGFNNLNMGSTLIWRDPGRRVFIDARNEVTGEAFMRRYLEIFEPGGWPRAQREFGFEYAVLRYNDDMSAVNLARRLDREAAWRLVHVDGNAVVFARVGGPNDSIPAASLPSAVEAEERRLRLADLAAAGAPRPAWFRWLWWNEPTPGADFELGTLLLFLGRLAPAEAPLLSAAKSSPGSGEVYNNLGELYWQRELWDAALIAYRRALANDPGNQVARSRVPRLAARSQP